MSFIGYPEPLEQKFRQVEQETERRAQEDAAGEREESPELSQKAEFPATNETKSRRRGSVSITRFGQLSNDRPQSSGGTSIHKPVTTLAAKSPLYAQLANDSVGSVASAGSTHLNVEEENHVTQVRFAGHHSISRKMNSFLPQRLTRSRSANVIAPREPSLRIGVSVEEATVESASGEHDTPSHASVHAGPNIRNKPPWLTLSGSSPPKSSWVARAKGFTQKFRRKDKCSGA